MSPKDKDSPSIDDLESIDQTSSEKNGNDGVEIHQEVKNIAESESESNFLVEALFIEKDYKIIIEEQRHQDQLRNKGFGEVFNKEYILDELEALYLFQNNKLTVNNQNQDFSFSDFLKILIKRDKKLLTKFLVYRDLRSKGYVVKNGFGFGTDFRVYERGEYNKKPSKYVAIGINEGTNIRASTFVSTIDQIEEMGKNAVIAVVERRGEVIYYKTSKVTFFENKKQNKNKTG